MSLYPNALNLSKNSRCFQKTNEKLFLKTKLIFNNQPGIYLIVI